MSKTVDIGPQQVKPGKLVIVGASAGGLEPMRDFFRVLGSRKEAAFVVIQHLSPNYKSMMGELLGHVTDLEVVMVEKDMHLDAGKIYLIPPGHNISLQRPDFFTLLDRQQGTINLPIDIFASSAAAHYGKDLALVILSGTGSDGVRGLGAVAEEGGLSFVLDPAASEFDGMPRNAIATGFVDETADARGLAALVTSFLKGVPAGNILVSSDDDEVQRIVSRIHKLLVKSSGIDFRRYKQKTVSRRLERRLSIKQLSSLNEYLAMLESDPAEVELLCRELMIGVTSFFRDHAAFAAFKAALLTKIQDKKRGSSLRIWIAGCSTGQEAYTVAILVRDILELLGKDLEVKIFATDAHQGHLNIAAGGVYAPGLVSDVANEFKEKYFVREGEFYRVKPFIRRMIVFAKHNMITDAPFTKLDAITCRNVLIYFKSELQTQVLRRFQYALVSKGLLFLGSSENLGPVQRDFYTLSASAKVYQAIRASIVTQEALETRPSRVEKNAYLNPQTNQVNLVDLGSKVITEQVAPPSVLLNASNEIAHIYGDISPYLSLSPGGMNSNIGRLVEPRTSAAILSLTKSVEGTGKPAQSVTIETSVNNEYLKYGLKVTPVPGGDPVHGYKVLSFLNVDHTGRSDEDGADLVFNDFSESTAKQIENLQEELRETRHNLQNTIEELEASNEETQATNEELIASNEELQSTNEELQSVNEELYIVNAEHQEKIRILDQLNLDLDTMTQATGIPTIFLDGELTIRRYTPSIVGILDLRENDIGRSIENFANKIGYRDLVSDARQALEKGEMRELVWFTSDTQRMIIRHVPYVDTTIGQLAVVVMFIDISKANETLESILKPLPAHIAVLDSTGRIHIVNDAWTKFSRENGGSAETTGVGANYLEVCQPVDSGSDNFEEAKVAREVRRVLNGEQETFSCDYPCHSDTEKRWFSMQAIRVDQPFPGAVVIHVLTSSEKIVKSDA